MKPTAGSLRDGTTPLVFVCGREDLNLHGITPTATSTLRVCQFRHDRSWVE
jgi:hypothetical protein